MVSGFRTEAYRENEECEEVKDFVVDLGDLDSSETEPGGEKEEEEEGACSLGD